MHKEILFPEEKAELYPLLCRQLASLAEDAAPLSTLANAAALLYEALPNINWAGFYLLQGENLRLGPFQGKTACTTIPVGRGVCGTAAKTRALQLVPDVTQFPGHIACDSASKSEIVVPLIARGQLLGVMDIDAPILARFDAEDATGLSAFANILSDEVDWSTGLL